MEIHRGIKCDGCEANPIRGKRYKCKRCPDYNNCSRCQREGKHSDRTGLHQCIMIDDVNEAPMEIHDGIKCNECEADPITGKRYKCKRCPDYNLCGTCEKAGKHYDRTGLHKMIRIGKPCC